MGDFGEVTCTGDRATCEKIDSSLEKNLIALLSGLGERSGFPPRAVKQEERQVSICHAWTRLSLPTGPEAPCSSEDTSQCGPKSLGLHLLPVLCHLRGSVSFVCFPFRDLGTPLQP